MQTIETAIQEAFSAARIATDKVIEDNPEQWYPCGFAWVRILPASGPLAKYLKENGMADRAYNGGLTVYNPSKNHTQWMDAKEAGAIAFKNSLVTWLLENPQKVEYKVFVESRMD